MTETIHYSRNAVFDAIAAAVHAEYPNAYCASRYEPVVQTFPTIYVTERTSESRRYMTLASDDDMYTSSIFVSIYTNDENGSESKAYDIHRIIRDTMRSLYYRMEYCEPVENNTPTIYRLESEYTRLIGSEDVFMEREVEQE